jgi:hypothetical protein
MATRQANGTTERAGIAQPVPNVVESLLNNGDLNQTVSISLNLNQWQNVVGALSIAAAELAIERNYQQMFEFTSICAFLGVRLGMTQTAGVSDSSPPLLTRAAGTP